MRMRTTKAFCHAGKNFLAYIINCPQIILSEDVTVFRCGRNSLVLYFWGVTVLALIYGGLGGTPRQGRQELGRSDAYCITCRPSYWEIMFQFVRNATFSKQVERTASPGCSFLNKIFGNEASVRKRSEVWRYIRIAQFFFFILYFNCLFAVFVCMREGNYLANR